MLTASSSYPLLSVFWSMFLFMMLMVWFWLLIACFTDLFRRIDIGGGTKTLWVIGLIVLPFLGVFIYLLTQSQHPGERTI